LDNTSKSLPNPSPSPLFAWPRPGPDAPQVPWPEFLRRAAEDCERRYSGSPGRFLAGYIHALSAQARALGADGPESHEDAAEQVRLQEAAYFQALEEQSGYWSISDPEPDSEQTGALDGHPAGEAESARQYWISDPGLEETYLN
jgi:hypothetical protein